MNMSVNKKLTVTVAYRSRSASCNSLFDDIFGRIRH